MIRTGETSQLEEEEEEGEDVELKQWAWLGPLLGSFPSLSSEIVLTTEENMLNQIIDVELSNVNCQLLGVFLGF